MDIKSLTEKEYRLLDFPSYSSIKDFIRGRLFYYKKYILKEKIVDKLELSEDVIFGNLVDTLKFSEDEFDDRFVVATAKKPNGQLLTFVEGVYKLCADNINEYGIFCGNMNTIFEQEYDNLVQTSKTGKIRDSLDKIKEKFFDIPPEDLKGKEYIPTGAKEYFDQLRNKGTKALITSSELEWGHSIKDYMNTHPFTRDLMTLQNSSKYEVIDQLKLIGEINGVRVKMMGDRVIFNLSKKIITPLDLKVMTNNTVFPYNYLKLKYYIQNGVYTSILKQNYPEWVVKPLAFITIDKYRKNDPIIFKTSEKQYLESLNGFDIDGRYYKGLKTAVDELNWHISSNIWTSDKAIHDSKGYTDLILLGQTED